jgi:Domain of unknown function (DUF5753)/Helix-turn-helix domain
MVEGPTGSTVPRRQLGRGLRDLRGKARMTVKAAATALEWSEAKMWRVETGQTSVRALDVEQMCRVYGAPADLTESLMALARETKAKGWWLDYADAINEGFDVYLGLEESADRLCWYESELVPGLFQTEDYARTLIRADNPDDEEAEVERRVHVRMERQVLLTRATNPPHVSVVLNEAIVRRPVGGRKVMASQLARLVELGGLNNVAMRVMPFSTGMHPGIMSGPFVVLDFPVNGNGTLTEPPIVYVDGYTGALYLDKPHEIERYTGAFKDIWSASLDEAASKRFISKAVEEMKQ